MTITELPRDLGAENAVLGSALIDPDAALTVRSTLEMSDFFDIRNRAVYRALIALVDRNDPVDVSLLCDELERQGDLDESVNATYVLALINTVPSALNAESYAWRVSEMAQRRRLISAATDVARAAYNAETIEQALDRADAAYTAAVSRRGAGKVTMAHEAARAVYDQATAYHEDPLLAGEVRGLSMGLPDLNAAMGGWQIGLYVALGVPHIGKSWFVDCAAAYVAQAGGRVASFSLEMSAQQKVERLCLAHAGARKNEYERGRLSVDQQQLLYHRATQISEWDMLIDDRSETLGAIATNARTMHRKKLLDLITIDCLGLIGGRMRETRNIQLGEYTRALHLLARELSTPIVLVHHISDKLVAARAEKRPQFSDAYESGHIGQNADAMFGVYRDEFYDTPNQKTSEPHVMEISVLKDRIGGNTGRVVKLYFRPTGGILPIESREQPPPLPPSWRDHDGTGGG